MHLLLSDHTPNHHPLAVEGTSVHVLYPQLIAILAAQLTSEHVALFCRPVAGTGTNDWYADTIARPVRLDSLPEPVWRGHLTRLEVLLNDLQVLAQRGGPNSRYQTLLESVTPVLDRRYVFIADDQLMLCMWGMGLEAEQPFPPPKSTVLMTPAEATETTAEPTRDTSRDQSRWWHTVRWWSGTRRLGNSALLLIILLVFLFACLFIFLPTVLPGLLPDLRVTPDPVDLAEKPLDVMTGKWFIRGMINTESGEKIRIEYNLNLNGTGTRTITSANGNLCVGPTSMQWIDNERIQISSKPAACKKGGAFSAERINCEPAVLNQPAHCEQIDGSAPDSILLEPIIE